MATTEELKEIFDKRSLERKHLFFYLRVTNMDTQELIGQLLDITTEGLMLISEVPVPTKKQFNLKMDLPGEVDGRKEITFKAESLWAKSDSSNSDFYNTGFRIFDITLEDKKVIEYIIHRFGFKD